MTYTRLHTHTKTHTIYDNYFQHHYQMVTHSGASLHRWWYFPLRSPISSALWSHNIWFCPTPYTCLCLIKVWPGPGGHFVLFSIFLLLDGGKIRTGSSRRSKGNGAAPGQIPALQPARCNLQVQRRNGLRGHLSIERRSCQSLIQPRSRQSVH